MRRLASTAAAFALAFTACLGGGAQTRSVLVDFTHDQYAGSFLDYFPNHIEVRPGDTVRFRQTWSGEPHSVTMGTQADKLAAQIEKDGYFEKFAKGGYEALPQEPPKDIAKLEKPLPWMAKDNGEAAQNGAQPCFLRHGFPPKDQNKPCTKAQQRQPAFDGKFSYYNSGFIPYEGAGGNTYTIKIAADASPGRHFFYCNYHGEFMSGWLTIKPKGAKIASQDTVNRQAHEQIAKLAAPPLKAYRAAKRGAFELPDDAVKQIRDNNLDSYNFIRTSSGKNYFRGWFGGLYAEGSDTASINEFVPKDLHAKVGQRLTWLILGQHTLSFNVPKYFPIIEVKKDGTVRRNPELDPPHGGAPKHPQSYENGNSKPLIIGAKPWDGRGFWSSGVVGNDPFVVYSLSITRPGTYKFACLIHPPMVGTLTVTR